MALSQPTHSSTSQSHLALPQLPLQLPNDHRNDFQAESQPATTKNPSQSAPSLVKPSSATTPSPNNDTITRPPPLAYKHRQSTLSLSSSKHNRSGLFNLAALARDKTSSAIASFSEPSLRSQPSSGSLYRSAQSSPTSPSQTVNPLPRSPADSQSSIREKSDSSSSATPPFSLSHQRNQPSNSGAVRHALLETNPPSQAYSNTASNHPPPVPFKPARDYSKMHQTSSRLLRMTNDDRPFTRVGGYEGTDPWQIKC